MVELSTLYLSESTILAVLHTSSRKTYRGLQEQWQPTVTEAGNSNLIVCFITVIWHAFLCYNEFGIDF